LLILIYRKKNLYNKKHKISSLHIPTQQIAILQSLMHLLNMNWNSS